MVKFQPTHALRTDPFETKDCTVIAVTAASGLSYNQVHSLAAEAGRVYRRGFHSERILMKAQANGFLSFTGKELNMYETKHDAQGYATWAPPYPTLAEVIRKFPTGRHVVETRRHAFAIVDGVVMDNSSKAHTRARIHSVYTVSMPTKAPALAQSDINEMWERLNRIKL